MTLVLRSKDEDVDAAEREPDEREDACSGQQEEEVRHFFSAPDFLFRSSRPMSAAMTLGVSSGGQ